MWGKKSMRCFGKYAVLCEGEITDFEWISERNLQLTRWIQRSGMWEQFGYCAVVEFLFWIITGFQEQGLYEKIKCNSPREMIWAVQWMAVCCSDSLVQGWAPDGYCSIIFLMGVAVIAVVFGFVWELLELVLCWCSWCKELYSLLVERMVWGVSLLQQLGMLMMIFGAFDPSVKELKEMLLYWKMLYKK